MIRSGNAIGRATVSSDTTMTKRIEMSIEKNYANPEDSVFGGWRRTKSTFLGDFVRVNFSLDKITCF